MPSGQKLDEQKKSTVGFFSKKTQVESDEAASPIDMEIDDLITGISRVSIRDITRAALTNTNSAFTDLCNQLSNVQLVDNYRENMTKEADLIAMRVEADLDTITKLHGESKDTDEENHRVMVVHVTQAYKRCLELDIEKWKNSLKLNGQSINEIASIKVNIAPFTPWECREHTSPAYREEKAHKPSGNTIVDQIAFVQLALNYWRSCYRNIREYEKLINIEPYSFEKHLWNLEQAALSYLDAAHKGAHYSHPEEINFRRINEPRNINPKTGEPVSIASIQEMIQQNQEKSGYNIQKSEKSASEDEFKEVNHQRSLKYK